MAADDMCVADVLDKNIIDMSLDASSKQDALRKMSELLHEAGYVGDVEEFLADILHRETLGETGIGNYIAIPHGQSDSVKSSTICVAKLTHEIEWETLDGKGVKVILLFAVQNDASFAKTHLRMLAGVARRLAKDEVVRQLLAAETSDEVIDCFR
ncbi:MAG: fructose PTS transporter subunit IIA [Atopobiaceae bacterium]|jgi:PTS system fructose-specific IIA component|nr:fructose PTS transporter subunit IIA [Atopobiaceae bacterium]MCI2206886.1 fructose PTS transporter subunit IIA [Atopobiaceae bacterium]